MGSLNNRTYNMSKADIKPLFPAASDDASNRFLLTLSGIGNYKAVTLFIAVICFLMTANLNAQTLEWVKVVGGNGFIKGNSIAIDDDGNFYITGVFLNTNDWEKPGSLFTLDGGKIFVQKLDAKGKFLWTKLFGGNKCDKGNSIAIDEGGNIYTTGYFNDIVDFSPGVDSMKLASAGKNDVFIQKLDKNGNFIWAKSFGGKLHDKGTSIAIDEIGNIFTTGTFQDTVDFDPGKESMNLYALGNDDIFIQKLDKNGNFIWAKSFGGKLHDEGTSIAVDEIGNIFTTGTFQDTIDFNPGKNFTHLSSAGESDIFIMKLDANGNFLWAKSFGGKMSDNATDLAIDGKGNVYSTGTFMGFVDFDPGKDSMKMSAVGIRDIYIQKLDTHGNLQWVKTIVGKGCDNVNSLVVDGVGNVYTTGYFNEGFIIKETGAILVSSTDPDTFIQKFDAQGNLLWFNTFGGNDYEDYANSIAIDNKDNVFTIGYFSGTVDFDQKKDGIKLTAGSCSDIFVLKIK